MKTLWRLLILASGCVWIAAGVGRTMSGGKEGAIAIGCGVFLVGLAVMAWDR